MKRRVILGGISAIALLVGLAAAPDARAQQGYRNDLNLSKLLQPYVDANGRVTDPTGANSAFRSLMSQMGMVFAPMFHSPAETTGYSGFALSAKYGATTIHDKADYWRNGVNQDPDPVMSTLALEVRKGIWFPIPSFELGAGLTHLAGSHLFTLNAFAKFSIHEDFHHWPTPAAALRFSAARMFGTSHVDLTVLSLDASISKSFGVAGTMNFTPYLGYNVLWIIADSQVIDATPGRDSLQCSLPGADCANTGADFNAPIPNGQFCTSADCGANYVFDDQSAILRHRIFIGLRMIYYRFVLTLEAAWALKGNSADSLAFGLGKIKDRSDLQQTYSVSVGWDY
jgi:hypothetical protein